MHLTSGETRPAFQSVSKKYKGKTCVYCGGIGISDTRDHVLAREFVLERHRLNLPAVPACKACNNAKSKLETELTTVLPFGGRHADANENMSTMVPKRLRANPGLRSEIERDLTPVWLPTPSGIFQRTSIIQVDSQNIDAWVSLLTIGLIWYHWSVIVAGVADVELMLVPAERENIFSHLFKAKVSRRVPPTSIGGDALIYEGVMGHDNPLASAWRFAIYGGLQLGGDDPRRRATTFYVTVIPRNSS